VRELLERDDELARLHGLLDGALAGEGGLLMLEGDAGIGKTGLVGVAAGIAADRGMRVLTARGAELECDLAFGVARDLLGPAASTAADGAAGLAAPVLARSQPTELAESGTQLFAALYGLYWLTAELGAAQPTLLAVDDAHWCDLPSLRFLAYLARRLDGLPVALLVAARPAAGGPQQDLLSVLAAEPLAMVARPRPLGHPAIRALLSASIGPADPGFVAACHTATGGNPFLLGELIAELETAGIAPRAASVGRLGALVPHGVRRVVVARLARLPTAAAALARAAAVLGDGANPRHVARLAGIPEDGAGVAADALVAARLMEPHIPLTFLHPLLRSAAATTLGPAELAAAHRRAARILAADGEPGDTLVPHLLAAQTTGDPWVVDALQSAARGAAARGDPEVAARYLVRALGEPPPPGQRAGLLHDLGLAEMHAGLPDAHRHLAAAAELATDPVDRARACLTTARGAFLAGRLGEAVTVCERALGELAGGHPELILELEVELVGAARQDIAHRPLALRVLARSADPPPDSVPGCMMLANLAVEEAAALGSRERAAELARRAFRGDRLFDTRALNTLPLALYALALAGRAREALRRSDEAIARYRTRGEVQGYAVVTAFRCYINRQLGDIGAAESDARTALDLARAHDVRFIEAHAVAWLVEALVDVGDIDTADREIGGQAGLIAAGDQFVATRLLAARGYLRLTQGRPDEAVDDLRACGRGLAAWKTRNPWLCPWTAPLVLALLARGDATEARQVAARALRLARRWGAPYALAESLRVAGQAAAGPDGKMLLHEAVAVAGTAELPLEEAHALAALGGKLRRAGRRQEAREPLRAALDRAVGCGATVLARQTHEELLASGAQPRRLRSTGAGSLTYAERRVAAMAAAGGTNRSIAQALFVAEKTVETHLGHVYRKLGISVRPQLAAALAGRE
jgi:DNA-binding CsgD family transcriptional regulator/tetratricopeptide (TPR) repeat protein